MAADCAACLKWYNRYVYGNSLSPDEQACCVEAEKQQIQSVADVAAQYYDPGVAQASQTAADYNKSLAAGDVANVNASVCPFPVGGECFQSLSDLLAKYGKYAVYAGVALVGLYVILLIAPLIPRRSN